MTATASPNTALGMSETSIGVLMMLDPLAGFFGQIFWAIVCDRTKQHKMVLSVSACLVVVVYNVMNVYTKNSDNAKPLLEHRGIYRGPFFFELGRFLRSFLFARDGPKNRMATPGFHALIMKPRVGECASDLKHFWCGGKNSTSFFG